MVHTPQKPGSAFLDNNAAWAAVLPIITGVAGVGISSLTVILLSHVMTLPSVAPELGALIGLGVGIDYALFIVNRHRKALRQGAGLADAISTAMSTSGAPCCSRAAPSSSRCSACSSSTLVS
jgi:uncharacterized membrane protein YdfJ with MMPL/SSD domain